jgi:hypothetical protein
MHNEWVTKNVKGIHSVYAAKEDFELHRTYKCSITCINSSCRLHLKFVALNVNKVKIFRLSGNDCITAVDVSPEPEVEAITGRSIHYFHLEQFVAVIYGKDWCTEFMIKWSDEHQNMLVKLCNKTYRYFNLATS